ncbi:MAG: hypothetical protein H0T44_05725 [Gemmatimonadales bacterium]|nr:hypothetical protein [Gemmatimonadales bacterium]
MNETHREARLKPEHAALYPGVGPGEWKPVGELLDTILSSRLLGQRSSAEFLQGRLLDERHFEFRGESPASAMRPGPRSRVSD